MRIEKEKDKIDQRETLLRCLKLKWGLFLYKKKLAMYNLTHQHYLLSGHSPAQS